MRQTTLVKPNDVKKTWYIVDAEGKTLGRLVFDEKMTKKILVNLYNTYNMYKKRYKIA